MLLEWFQPVLDWLGTPLVPFLLIIIIILLLINLLRG